jgi:hypothetical protein
MASRAPVMIRPTKWPMKEVHFFSVVDFIACITAAKNDHLWLIKNKAKL